MALGSREPHLVRRVAQACNKGKMTAKKKNE
jgi:hypothetical protein